MRGSEVTFDIQDADRLPMHAELGPREDLHEFFQGTEATGKGDETVGQVGHPLLARMHRVDDLQLLDPAVRDLVFFQEHWKNPSHESPALDRRVGERAHEPAVGAAIDEAVTPIDDLSSEGQRRRPVFRPSAEAGATEDAQILRRPHGFGPLSLPTGSG